MNRTDTSEEAISNIQTYAIVLVNNLEKHVKSTRAS